MLLLLVGGVMAGAAFGQEVTTTTNPSMSATVAPSGDRAAADTVAPAFVPGTGPPVICTPEHPATLEVAPGALTSIPFGRGREPRSLSVKLRASGCEFNGDEVLRVAEFDPPQRESDGLVIDKENQNLDCAKQAVQAGNSLCWRIRQPATMFLYFHVDPRSAAPGKYKSTLDVGAPFMKPFSVTVTATLQYPKWYLLAPLMVPVLVVGTYLVWAASSRPLFDRNLRSLAKFFFAVGAAGGAYYGTYWRNETWGSDSWQLVTLAGAVLTAYMSSLVAGLAAQGKSTA